MSIEVNAVVASFEERVTRARAACLNLYLDDPNPESAKLLVTLEKTVTALRRQRERDASDPSDP